MPIAEGRHPHQGRAAHTRSVRGGTLRRVLLAAGPVSSLLYVVATDGLAASRWDGYLRAEQMVSELFAVGSPAAKSWSRSRGSTQPCSSLSEQACGCPSTGTAPCASPAAC